jgi:putative DNA primase/helicase
MNAQALASSGLALALRALGDRGLRRTGDGWQARCPAHEDRRASLSVGVGADGRALLYCHAGCDTEAVVSALGLTMAGLMPAHDERHRHTHASTPRDPATRGRIIALYDYRDEHGELLYQVIRRDPKDFQQRRPTTGGWTWSLGDVRRVLYRLPELLATKTAESVFVVEGEKDAEALAKLGLCATTNAGGAGKWRHDYSEVLRGRSVVILPDNDEPGRKHAVDVVRALGGSAASVKVLELPGLPDKGDVSDWLAKGGTTAALLALVEEAPIYVDRGPTPTPAEKPSCDTTDPKAPPVDPVPATEDPGELDDAAGTPSDGPKENTANGGQVVALRLEAWPEPEALPDGLPAVPIFDDRLLPDALRPWLSDVAERTQCPPEYAAVGVMVALGAIVGRGCAIRPKRQDDWTVVPNTWGAVVGPPSSMKSPALAEALRPVRRLATVAIEEYRSQLQGYAAVLAEAKARRSVIEGNMKKSAAKSGNVDMTALRAEFGAAADPPEPTERRYLVNDATVEKLGELLNQNRRGLLHYRDELSGWLATLDRDGHENDRSFFLEAWNGTGPYIYDRIARGTLHIEAACVSMLGGIQPGPLAQYLRGAVRGGIGDDGLMQRFQLLVYPDPPRTWRNVDRWPDSDARNRAFEVFRRLDALTPEAVAAETDDGLPFLRFEDEAQALFDSWREDLMSRLRAGNEHPAIESHLAKYPSLLPSIALLCHLADATATAGPVALASARRAAAWCDLLEAHARRIYHTVANDTLKAAHAVLAKLRGGALGPTFSAKDVWRPQWAGLADREVVLDALNILEDLGWIRRTITPDTGGRPRTEYEAHPSLRDQEPA